VRITRRNGIIRLEDGRIIWAWAREGYCSACRKPTALDYHGPEVMVERLKVNLNGVGVVQGASRLSCVNCTGVVDKAMAKIAEVISERINKPGAQKKEDSGEEIHTE
jgi:hypothetical protein